MAHARREGGLPPWLKKRIPAGRTGARVREILKGLRLNTVCGSAQCPNVVECFHAGTATFLIMGPSCTRGCRFCAVDSNPPAPLEDDEPERVARAAAELALSHVVVTSVTRDDLADGGAAHFARTIHAIKSASPGATVEVLVPDFAGNLDSVATVLDAGPDVFNHNVETVARLYPQVRPQAGYARSLGVLAAAAGLARGRRTESRIRIKSGIMVGVGERIDEVEEVFADLRKAGVAIVTAGQYLAPSKEHLAVERFVTPEEFAALERKALDMGFEAAFCAPLVRSSYHAGEVLAGRGGARKGFGLDNSVSPL